MCRHVFSRWQCRRHSSGILTTPFVGLSWRLVDLFLFNSFIFHFFFFFLVSCCPELNYCHWEHPSHKLESYQKPVIGKNAWICGDSKGNYRFTFLLCAFVRLCTAWLNEKRSKTDITRVIKRMENERKKILLRTQRQIYTHETLYSWFLF